MQSIIITLVGYVAGSIPTGKLIGHLHGKDIQQHGSGNIGFANAVRVLGWPSGLVVLAVDIAKGFVPVYIAKQLASTDTVVLATGLAAILGHAFPVWLRFKGGKSIATGLGVTLVLQPIVALLGFAVYCVVFSLTRVSGKSSVIGAWSLPLTGMALGYPYSAYLLILALFATYTHRSNIYEYIQYQSK